MRRDKNSCDQLRRAEKRKEDMRWDEMKRKTLRRHDMRWDKMGWHRLRWQRDAMSNFQEKLQCHETRCNEKRTTFKRDGTGMKSQEVVAAKHRRPASNLFVPLYKLIIGVSILKLPPPACPGTTCKSSKIASKSSKKYYKVKSISHPEYEDFMVCDTRSGARWFLSMCVTTLFDA